MSGKVYILDEVTVVPGRVREFRARYLEEYAPGARGRGMTLESIRLTPPFEWDEGSNTICVLWSVDGAAGWWTMRIGGPGPDFDPSGRKQGDWWKSVEHLIASRRRNFYVDYAVEEASA